MEMVPRGPAAGPPPLVESDGLLAPVAGEGDVTIDE
jgi:hypothetical protein